MASARDSPKGRSMLRRIGIARQFHPWLGIGVGVEHSDVGTRRSMLRPYGAMAWDGTPRGGNTAQQHGMEYPRPWLLSARDSPKGRSMLRRIVIARQFRPWLDNRPATACAGVEHLDVGTRRSMLRPYGATAWDGGIRVISRHGHDAPGSINPVNPV